MSFLSGIFGGSGGQTQTSNTNSTSNVNYAPWYEQYTQDLLNRGTELSKTPFQPYDISKMYAPFQPAQLQAFNQVGQNQTAYYPYINSAGQMLNSVSGISPYNAGMPYINQAGQSPNGMQAGAGYLSAGTQTWNPQTQANYGNPFLAGSVDFANQLATQNFLERTIPGVNAQFVKSGGGLGGKNYADYMGRTVRDFSNNMLGQNQTAMAGNYWNSANQFNQDMNRYLQAGTNLGGLANNTMGALGNLGQQAAGVANTGVGAGINMSNAYSGLGGALSNLNLTNSNALLQVGNQQQQQAQLPLTAAYQQYQQGIQFPYQQLSFLNQLQQGLRIPSTQQTQSTQTQNVSSNSSPSPLGGILGTIGSAMSIPGVSDWVGGLFKGNLGGGTVTASPTPNMGGVTGATWTPGTGPGTGYQFPPGSGGFGNGPLTAKRGGHIRREAKRNYSAGGTVPVIAATNRRAEPALRSLAARQRPPVPMPTPSSGALSREAAPFLRGALSTAR